MVFATQGYFHWLSHGKAPDRTSAHLVKALRLLRERISLDEKEMLTDSTAAVVLVLTVHAYMAGESEPARHHMMGLRKIVDLRGGVASFKESPKLLLEILR